MPPWPVLILLTASMFVGRVCPVLQIEGHDNNAVAATANVTVKTNNMINVANNNANKTIESSTKAVDDKKDTLNKTKSSSSSLKTTNVNVNVPPIKKYNCNSTKEQVDMLNCYVTPSLDSGEDTEEKVTTSTIATTTVTTSKPTETTKSESQKPKDTSPKTKEENVTKSDANVVLLNQTEVEHASYDIGSTESSHSINASDTDTNAKLDTNRTEVSISPVVPLPADNVPSAGSKDVVQESKSVDQGRTGRMPSGMIALVIAISFAIAIAIVYIGMIVWRRYIEYRYGHRELLVNELEFDTNDLRHFEL
ncbi:uncharacterized protein LOC143183872 [Calliopsis andreniformis]|uniref:uncharacterized protein LOC143183872 n=1 Tax=Calliopsis andreniformis TaxID=337506 RepID=UPI003FCE467C